MSQRRQTAHLVFLSVLYLGGGLAMLTYDTVLFAQPISTSRLFNEATHTSRPTSQIVATMIMAAICVVIGICGFVSIFVKSLKFSTFLIGFVTMEFILRVLLCAITVYATIGLHRATGDSVKTALLKYGDKPDQANIDFTEAVDKYSDMVSCCGWGVEEDENSYMETEWYKRRNESTSAAALENLLPQSCCSSKVPSTIELCTKASSMQTARIEGTIHHNNCLNVFTTAMRKFLLILIGSHVLLLVIDALFAFSSMKSMTNADDSASSSSSPSTDAKKNSVAGDRDKNGDDDDDNNDDDDDSDENIKGKKA